MLNRKKINAFQEASNQLAIRFRSKGITYNKLCGKFIKLSYALFGSCILFILFFVLFVIYAAR